MTVRKMYFLTAFLATLGLIFPDKFAQGEAKLRYLRTVETYEVPDVTLVNQNGRKVRLRTLLNSDKPVLLDFIYTTCKTTGPLLSIGFSDFQKKLGPESEGVQLVSISTDPDNDTPEMVKTYLKRHDAKAGWDFLTGARADIDKVLKAFKVRSSDEIPHPPLILLRLPTRNNWVRIYGLIETTDLIREYQKVLK